VTASAATRERCLAAVSRSVRRALDRPGRGGEIILVVEIEPVVAGVAEAAEVMGWDKRRIVTYIDRARFPKPLQTLASGRIWLRSDIEAFADQWRSRQRTRRPAGPAGPATGTRAGGARDR
jgi:predicted DNA-binding transcriptional regulator AlpA